MYAPLNEEITSSGENLTIEELNVEEVKTLIPAIVYTCFLMPCGVIGNAVVIYIYTVRFQASNYRYFILTLGVCDLVTSAVCMPFFIVDMLRPFTFKNFVACKVLRYIAYNTALVSMFTLFFIAVERYRKICRPFKAQITLPLARRILLVIVFLSAAVFSLPSVVLYGHSTVYTGIENTTGVACFIDDVYRDTHFPVVYNFSLLVVVSFLGTGMVFCYIKIAHQRFQIAKTRRARKANSSSATDSSKSMLSSDQNAQGMPANPPNELKEVCYGKAKIPANPLNMLKEECDSVANMPANPQNMLQDECIIDVNVPANPPDLLKEECIINANMRANSPNMLTEECNGIVNISANLSNELKEDCNGIVNISVNWSNELKEECNDIENREPQLTYNVSVQNAHALPIHNLSKRSGIAFCSEEKFKHEYQGCTSRCNKRQNTWYENINCTEYIRQEKHVGDNLHVKSLEQICCKKRTSLVSGIFSLRVIALMWRKKGYYSLSWNENIDRSSTKECGLFSICPSNLLSNTYVKTNGQYKSLTQLNEKNQESAKVLSKSISGFAFSGKRSLSATNVHEISILTSNENTISCLRHAISCDTLCFDSTYSCKGETYKNAENSHGLYSSTNDDNIENFTSSSSICRNIETHTVTENYNYLQASCAQINDRCGIPRNETVSEIVTDNACGETTDDTTKTATIYTSSGQQSNSFTKNKKTKAGNRYKKLFVKRNFTKSAKFAECRDASVIRMTKVLFVITMVYFISFTPHLVFMCILLLDSNFLTSLDRLELEFYYIALRSFLINAVANPFVYNFMDRKFRTECRKILHIGT